MYTSLISISSLLLLTPLASAAVLAKRADAPGPTIWKSPNGGNTQVRFGDGKVHIGGCTPDRILDSVYDNCYEEGFCNSKEWTLQCTMGDRGTHTITVSAPEGQFQAKIRKEFIDALKAAIKTPKVVSSRDITAVNGGGCTGCPFFATKMTVYDMPSSFGISHTNDGTVPDVITLRITNGSEGKGLCEILTGIGGGLASAVNGAAGGLFQLGSVACKAA